MPTFRQYETRVVLISEERSATADGIWPGSGLQYCYEDVCPAKVVPTGTAKEEGAMNMKKTTTGDKVRLIIIAILIAAALLLWLAGR